MENKILEQMIFCMDLADRLGEAVKAHEEYQANFRTSFGKDNSHGLCYDLKDKGASKYQIQASIVQLRRELMALSRMFED